MNWEIWLHGLVGAFIGGAAAALSGAVTMPNTFSFTKAGLANMARIGVGAGLASAFLYLRQSPIWTTVTTAKLTDDAGNNATLEVTRKEQ